jgi:hypothetical protein
MSELNISSDYRTDAVIAMPERPRTPHACVENFSSSVLVYIVVRATSWD